MAQLPLDITLLVFGTLYHLGKHIACLDVLFFAISKHEPITSSSLVFTTDLAFEYSTTRFIDLFEFSL